MTLSFVSFESRLRPSTRALLNTMRGADVSVVVGAADARALAALVYELHRDYARAHKLFEERVQRQRRRQLDLNVEIDRCVEHLRGLKVRVAAPEPAGGEQDSG